MIKLRANYLFALAFLLLLTSCSFKEMEFIGLTKIESRSIKLSESALDLTFKVENPNWYGYKLKNSAFKLEIAGSNFELIGDQKWKIKPGTNYLNAQIKFNPITNIAAIGKILLGKTQISTLNLNIKGSTDAKVLFAKKTFYIDEKVPIKDVFND